MKNWSKVFDIWRNSKISACLHQSNFFMLVVDIPWMKKKKKSLIPYIEHSSRDDGLLPLCQLTGSDHSVWCHCECLVIFDDVISGCMRSCRSTAASVPTSNFSPTSSLPLPLTLHSHSHSTHTRLHGRLRSHPLLHHLVALLAPLQGQCWTK
jgi:hypothetical protein